MAAAKYSSVLIAPGIRERNDDSCKGFIVRYFRWKAHFNRSFPIADFPNREAALETAKAYYKELVEAFPPMTRKEFAEVVRRKNASGTPPGVTHRAYKVKGHQYYCWHASWSPEPGKRPKHVSFNYGIERTEEEAKRLAIEARKKGLEEMQLRSPARYRQQIAEDAALEKRIESLSEAKLFQDIYAYEGKPVYRLHASRERNRNLRNEKIKSFQEQHGEIFCEICGFSFFEKYGNLGFGLIEVHHLQPLSKLTEETATNLEDLMLICPNCHMVIHSGEPNEMVHRLRIIFGQPDKFKKRSARNN
jgi:predicted HNH restriction endonuclease